MELNISTTSELKFRKVEDDSIKEFHCGDVECCYLDNDCDCILNKYPYTVKGILIEDLIKQGRIKY